MKNRNTIIIRNAEEADLDIVSEIESESLNLWKKEFFFEELLNKNSLFIVAEEKNRILGFAVSLIVHDEGEILTIAIKNELQREKLGSLLLSNIIQTYSNMKIKILYLEVNEKNKKAIAFYKKHLFDETGIRKNYYSDGNALLMKRVIANESK